MSSTPPPPSDANPELDADALFAALEAEDDLDEASINPSYRAARLQQLSREIAQSKQDSNKPADNYRTIKSDPEVLTFTTEHPRAILHFYHPDFSRCSVMDQHLETLARLHNDTGSEATVFSRVNVQNAEFVVQKLNVRVLPCVIGFVGGVARERITGFEGVAFGGDEKSRAVTQKIETLFFKAGVLTGKRFDDEGTESEEDQEERLPTKNDTARRGIRDRKYEVGDSDGDWD